MLYAVMFFGLCVLGLAAIGMVIRVRQLRQLHEGTRDALDADRLRAAPLPADLATLVQGDRVLAIKQIREASGLDLRDSKRVYDLARAGKL